MAARHFQLLGDQNQARTGCLCDVSLSMSLFVGYALCCDVMLALCVSWVCLNPVCLAAWCQQTAMAEAPFELDSVKLRSLYKDGADMVEDRRGELMSWFRRRTITKPEVVFFADRPDHFKVGDKDVFWNDLAVAWDDGRDGVFTFLGVEVDVSDQAMAWKSLGKLLKPGMSPPCPLLLPLVAPVSPLWPSRFA